MDRALAQTLVEAAKAAMARSRWFFGAVVVGASMHILTLYNAYFSWLRTIFVSKTDHNLGANMVGAARAELLKEWVKSTYVDVPLLGVKTSIFDASVTGSAALLLLTIGLFYSMRRENHIVGKVLRMASATEIANDTKKQIYYGLSMSSVFSTLTQNDTPIKTLDPPDASQEGNPITGLVRWMTDKMFYLPAIAILMTIICDALSLFVMGSAFRDAHVTVASAITHSPNTWARIFVMEAIAVFCLFLCATLGFFCREYQVGKTATLRAFSRILYGEPSAAPPPPPSPQAQG